MNKQILEEFLKAFDKETYRFDSEFVGEVGEKIYLQENCLQTQMYDFAYEKCNNIDSNSEFYGLELTNEFFGFERGLSEKIRYDLNKTWAKISGKRFIKSHSAKNAIDVIKGLIRMAEQKQG